MKNELLIQEINGERIVMESARNIADQFEKRNADVMRSIRKAMKLNDTGSECKSALAEGEDEIHQYRDMILLITTYKDAQGKIRPEYLINEDLFLELVMGFNGDKAADIRYEYRKAFKTMKEQLENIAIQTPQAFVDSLSLTVYSIETYMPNFLTFANCAEICTALIERVDKEVKSEVAGEKTKLLSALIRVINKQMELHSDNVAKRQLLLEASIICKDKIQKTLIAAGGGNSKVIADLKAENERLREERYDSKDFDDFLNNQLDEKAYEVFSKSINTYVNYISMNSSYSQKQVWNELYKNASRYFGLMLNNVSIDGISKIKAIWLQYDNVASYILKNAQDWAMKLGFQY